MQKISSYLYPNRINVVADVALFPVRWNIVYQNRVKVYKGVDNVLTIDVKNSDQKRIDISEMNLKMVVTDVNGLLVTEVDVIPGATTGLATATIVETDLINLTPQFLTFSIYRLNDDDTKTVLYADAAFGAKGNMELVGDIMPTQVPVRKITRFTVLTKDNVMPYIPTYFSDAVEIKQVNFVRDPSLDTLEFEFKFNSLSADVTVQFTKDTVVSAGTNWVDIETFNVTSSTSTLIKDYSSNYSREWAWARVTYIRTTGNTGNIDTVLVRL
jgi:hypothetical protein